MSVQHVMKTNLRQNSSVCSQTSNSNTTVLIHFEDLPLGLRKSSRGLLQCDKDDEIFAFQSNCSTSLLNRFHGIFNLPHQADRVRQKGQSVNENEQTWKMRPLGLQVEISLS